ncbi:MAG TPA: xanthine dehydrogenase family protein molybdopterin-binding subunit [Acidimicrobiales bacterium]|nr:xanthine dehydrogenase family protein molybdopterin-binding subunit [Acidimicrobiales bacterium]
MVNSLAVAEDRPADITDALVRGRARFAADLPIADVAELVFVRSPYAHARIIDIDVDAASRAPGVLAVLTARDMPELRLHEIHIISEPLAPPALAIDVARFVGDPVAVVVATTLAAALDAVELVDVTYEPLPIVATVDAAVRNDAPLLFPSHGSNVALAWDLDETDAAFAESLAPTLTVRGEIDLPRLATAPMEGHAIVVVPTGAGGLHVYVSTQWPHGTRIQMARSFGLTLDQVRAQVPAVGGGFGGKSLGGIREHIATAAAARWLNRPVRYIEQRNDNLQSMQGRGVHINYEADATSDGRVVHLRVEDLCDCGAYPSTGAVEPGKTMMMSTGPYRIGHVTFHARSVMTNLPPTGAYRGPGRAEASMVLEQVMDSVAHALDLDPLTVRSRNFMTITELPKQSITGAHYDEADFAQLVERARVTSGYERWRDHQQQRRATGEPNVLGVGVVSVFDSSAWFDRTDEANVRLTPDGGALVELSSSSAGQHHDGAIARIVGDELCLPFDRVRLIEGDTVLGSGGGSSGSRTIQISGHAARASALVMRQRLIEQAAHLLEAAADDVVLHDGHAFVRGVPSSSVAYADLVRAMSSDDLAACCRFEQSAATYPAAVDVAVVEVDTDTGHVRLLQLHTVTDCGTVLDAHAAHGQVAGASAQGIAQALYERASYDGDGNPLTASLAEYLMPSAADLPAVDVEFCPQRSSRNPLGAKGVGEVGMVAAPAAVYGAVLDALRPFGVTVLPMPCDPESVWRAINSR